MSQFLPMTDSADKVLLSEKLDPSPESKRNYLDDSDRYKQLPP